MIEFLQAYGSWILFGLFFLFMMRMHGSHGGMGCGMGDHEHGVTMKPPPKSGRAKAKSSHRKKAEAATRK